MHLLRADVLGAVGVFERVERLLGRGRVRLRLRVRVRVRVRAS